MTLEVLAGLSPAYLSMVENGKRSLNSYSRIMALADALRVSPAELALGMPAELHMPADDTSNCDQAEQLPGLAGADGHMAAPGDWRTDPLTDLANLGRWDLHADPARRRVLADAIRSAATLALPAPAWWQSQSDALPPLSAGERRSAGPGDVAAVQQLTMAFSKPDQLRGGALVQYLHAAAAALLRSKFG